MQSNFRRKSLKTKKSGTNKVTHNIERGKRGKLRGHAKQACRA